MFVFVYACMTLMTMIFCWFPRITCIAYTWFPNFDFTFIFSFSITLHCLHALQTGLSSNSTWYSPLGYLLLSCSLSLLACVDFLLWSFDRLWMRRLPDLTHTFIPLDLFSFFFQPRVYHIYIFPQHVFFWDATMRPFWNRSLFCRVRLMYFKLFDIYVILCERSLTKNSIFALNLFCIIKLHLINVMLIDMGREIFKPDNF